MPSFPDPFCILLPSRVVGGSDFGAFHPKPTQLSRESCSKPDCFASSQPVCIPSPISAFQSTWLFSVLVPESSSFFRSRKMLVVLAVASRISVVKDDDKFVEDACRFSLDFDGCGSNSSASFKGIPNAIFPLVFSPFLKRNRVKYRQIFCVLRNVTSIVWSKVNGWTTVVSLALLFLSIEDWKFLYWFSKSGTFTACIAFIGFPSGFPENADIYF